MIETTIRNLDELLAASAATPEFQEAARALSEGRSQDRILYNAGSPRVKTLRAVMKLLETRPHEPVESVIIQGRSGCSDFVGEMQIKPSGERIAFEWDCRWRAEELGWTDAFGDPDQIRAAQTFGYQCFRKFDRA